METTALTLPAPSTRGTLYDVVVTRARTAEALEPGECWPFEGSARSHNGYALVGVPGDGQRRVHRVAYTAAFGNIPEDLVLDHTCRTRECYRPSHLRAVDNRTNLLADGSQALAAKHAAKTRCPRGHLLAGENLRPSKRASGRECLRCHSAANIAYGRAARAGATKADRAVAVAAARESIRILAYLDLGVDSPCWEVTPSGWLEVPGTDPGLVAARAEAGLPTDHADFVVLAVAPVPHPALDG